VSLFALEIGDRVFASNRLDEGSTISCLQPMFGAKLAVFSSSGSVLLFQLLPFDSVEMISLAKVHHSAIGKHIRYASDSHMAHDEGKPESIINDSRPLAVCVISDGSDALLAVLTHTRVIFFSAQVK
jgi:hypothetical protein